MNCFSCRTTRRITTARLALMLVAVLAGCGAPLSASVAQARYDLTYTLTPLPHEQSVDVRIDVEQPRRLLRELSFPSDRVTDIEGDGTVTLHESGRVIWTLPRDGGSLRWRVHIPHRRNSSGYDAWLDTSFGLFRAEDVIPRARSVTVVGAESRTRLHVEPPVGWSVVTQYQRSSRGGYRVRSADRRFVSPSGWILLGDLGTRRDDIAGVRVAVTAPAGHEARRVDMLALLNWTLPDLVRLVPEPPTRLTIFSAGDPMWRGGLSAPASIFIHSGRPLISENGTSTLLHEIMHVVMGVSAEDGHDWLLEGFAEYYSLEILRRSGTLTAARHAQALTDLAEWAESAETLCGGQSSGPQTALAVMTLVALDAEIRERVPVTRNIDDLLRDLMAAEERLSLDLLIETSSAYIGEKPDALHIDRLPGCRIMSTAWQD